MSNEPETPVSRQTQVEYQLYCLEKDTELFNQLVCKLAENLVPILKSETKLQVNVNEEKEILVPLAERLRQRHEEFTAIGYELMRIIGSIEL